MMKKVQQGFTLIELMIVVAIIGILAAVAIPNYQNYTKKAKFTEVTQATQALKTAVEICAQDLGTVTGCSGGSNGIPADIASAVSQYVASIATTNGVITATAVSTNGLNSETYILTPTFDAAKGISWTTGGTCKSTSPPICK